MSQVIIEIGRLVGADIIAAGIRRAGCSRFFRDIDRVLENMVKSLEVAKWFVSLGKEPQNYLGAKWIPALLRRVPESRRPLWALRILSLSPHYFFDHDNPKYRGMSNTEYLEANFEAVTRSRENIYEKMLSRYLDANDTVLDYGCGPGFLAKATAPYVRKIYGLDLSLGAIECARIINSAENIEYIAVGRDGLDAIPDGGLDAVYSFAVIQHLTNEVFEIVLKNCYRKLKPGGQLLLHIQLNDETWKSEEEFRKDRSAKGRVKFKIGLHCFGRTEQEHIEIVSKLGFDIVEIKKLENFFTEFADEIRSQRLLVARKGD